MVMAETVAVPLIAVTVTVLLMPMRTGLPTIAVRLTVVAAIPAP
jgi:hypothetical protein